MPEADDFDRKMSDTSKYAHWLLNALKDQVNQGVLDHVEHLVARIDDLELTYYRGLGDDSPALF